MQFVELLLQVSLRVYHKGSIVEFFIVAARNGADSIHFVQTALLLNGFEGWGVLEVLCKLMHVFFDIG